MSARRTHCKNGHEMTPENTYVPPSTGGHKCRACQAAYMRKWHADSNPLAYKPVRLAIATAAAPRLRSQSAEVSARIVNIVNKDGKVIARRRLGDVQLGILRGKRIEFDVMPATRPKEAGCQLCGKSFKVQPRGLIPPSCPDGCTRVCACGAPITKWSAVRRSRKGLTPRCRSCAGKAARETAISNGSFIGFTTEARARGHAARRAKPQHERTATAQKAWETKRARGTDRCAATPEQKSEWAHRAWASRRRNAT